MKINLLFLSAILFLLAHHSTAQTPEFHYSSIRRPVQDKQDSLLLIRNEQKMWVEAKKGNVMMFDNPMLDCEFKVRMSKVAIQACFKDSIPLKSGASQYMMNLVQNTNADTCYLISFSPFLPHKYQERVRWVQDSVQQIQSRASSTGAQSVITMNYGHWEMGPWQTGMSVQFLMPLSEYQAVIPEKEMNKANAVYRNQFASQLNGKSAGDTIYRFVRFTRDSNEYLPQAPYANFLSYLKNGMLAGKFHVYYDENLVTRMNKAQVEGACVGWDSTNQVEDPNNPGVFIIAPVKYEGQVKTLLLYEKWNFFTPVNPAAPYNYAKNYMGCRRKVSAYGLLLTGGNIVWFSVEEINKEMKKDNFNFVPYEECFRAERFKTLQIQLHTW